MDVPLPLAPSPSGLTRSCSSSCWGNSGGRTGRRNFGFNERYDSRANEWPWLYGWFEWYHSSNDRAIVQRRNYPAREAPLKSKFSLWVQARFCRFWFSCTNIPSFVGPISRKNTAEAPKVVEWCTLMFHPKSTEYKGGKWKTWESPCSTLEPLLKDQVRHLWPFSLTLTRISGC